MTLLKRDSREVAAGGSSARGICVCEDNEGLSSDPEVVVVVAVAVLVTLVSTVGVGTCPLLASQSGMGGGGECNIVSCTADKTHFD